MKSRHLFKLSSDLAVPYKHRCSYCNLLSGTLEAEVSGVLRYFLESQQCVQPLLLKSLKALFSQVRVT